MASFDASSAVPDSLVLARQADRLARQATGTVMAGARPLGDRSNVNAAAAPGGVEALVKRYGTSKAPRRICSGCVALRNEGEGLKREVLRLRHGMRAMVVRLEALEGAAARGLGAAPPAGPPPADARPASPPPVAPARTTPARATPPDTPPPDARPPPAMALPTAAAWPPETPADAWPPEPAAARPGSSVVAGWGSATRVVAPGPGTSDAPPPAYSPPRRRRTYSPQRESSCVSSGVLDALQAILGCDRAALADEATQVSCELLQEAAAQGRAARTGSPTFGVALYERVAARLMPERRRAHRHRFNLTPEPRSPAGPPPPPDPAALYEEPAAPPDGAVAQ